MKFDKRGFTLVELLAVIVILAILILLALPTVLKIMDKAKKDAFKTEALSILNAAEMKFAAEGAKKTPMSISPCFIFNKDKNDLEGYIKYKPSYDAVIINSEDGLKIAISNGTFKIEGLTKANANNMTVEDGTLETGYEAICTPIQP